MKIYAKIKTKANEQLSSLYASGDNVELEDGQMGTVTDIDDIDNIVEVDVEDPNEQGVTGLSYQMPDTEVPLKKES